MLNFINSFWLGNVRNSRLSRQCRATVGVGFDPREISWVSSAISWILLFYYSNEVWFKTTYHVILKLWSKITAGWNCCVPFIRGGGSVPLTEESSLSVWYSFNLILLAGSIPGDRADSLANDNRHKNLTSALRKAHYDSVVLAAMACRILGWGDLEYLSGLIGCGPGSRMSSCWYRHSKLNQALSENWSVWKYTGRR